MERQTAIADLHMHTPASDGTINIDKRATIAKKRGLETIAVTDHDIISDQLTKRRDQHQDVEVITGVEVRADILDTKIEILGYFVDPTDDRLKELLQRARRFRKQRNRDLVGNLSSLTNLNLSYDRLDESVEGNLGRPHLAQRLVEEGVVSSIGEAFDEYLAEEGRAFVPMERLGYEEVIETIHKTGGVTSLAHPGRIRADTGTVMEMIEILTEAGLDGIEVWYPYGAETSPEYADITVANALELADQFDLIKTGGSDCHGPDSGKFRLGDQGVTQEHLESLRKQAETYSALA